MLYPSIDELLHKVGSKYLLVNVVGKRVEEMEKKEHYQLDKKEYKSTKNIGKALEEVSRGMIKTKQ